MSHIARMLARTVAVLALGLVAAGPVAAQPLDSLPAGARLRVTRAQAPTVVGTLVEADSTGLRLMRAGRSEMLFTPIPDLRQVQVSQGELSTSEAFWRGARVGAIVGASVGIVATALAIQEDRECECYVYVAPFVGVLSLAFTGVTTLAGGGIGVATRERWRTVWPR